MDDTVTSNRCGKPECEVARTGACAEGHEPLEACPFFGKAAQIDDSEDQDENLDVVAAEVAQTPDEVESDRIELPSGEALDIAEIDAFLRWRPIRLVTVVGEQDSGKTTLICSIYDRFLRGSFARHRFAGSRTLMGLERRMHYARLDSGLTAPDTPRTSLSDGARFFHFALVSENDLNTRTDLMLSDRAGEMYRQARDNSKVVSELIEVAKCDRLVLLLDGARLVNPAERSGAFQSVRQTLRAFLDGGALDANSDVQVVTTKWDLLNAQSATEKEATDKFLSDFKRRLRDSFEDRVATLKFFDVAARDPKGNLAPAFGVEQLLSDWLDRGRRPVATTAQFCLPLQTEFDRLLARTRMEVMP